MARDISQVWDGLLHDLSARRWAARARRTEAASLASLKAEVTRARTLARHLDKVISLAESRLAQPRIGSTTIGLPPGTDWSCRPDLWRLPLPRHGIAATPAQTRLGDHATLYHNCPLDEILMRQIRNQDPVDLAPFGVSLEVFGFTGSFLSLAIDLPPSAGEGLRQRHIFRAEIHAELERPAAMFARLNIRHGPNTEQVVQAILPEDRIVDFDLSGSDINEKRVEGVWLDIIVDRPAMNRILLRDVTVARYPRADM
jgi:hypothetical protein